MTGPSDRGLAGDKLGPGDALIVTDMQKDFLPGGTLAVPGGEELVPLLNRCIASFLERGLPIFATRDWHPGGHCSFRERGGPWPRHCVAGSFGAEFADNLSLPASTVVVSKATEPDQEAYSAFDGTDLDRRLRAANARRLFIGGLTTDYCVRATAADALRLGFSAVLVRDAVRAIDSDAGRRAVAELEAQGAVLMTSEELLTQEAKP